VSYLSAHKTSPNQAVITAAIDLGYPYQNVSCKIFSAGPTFFLPT
jgi:hypothetical protein